MEIEKNIPAPVRIEKWVIVTYKQVWEEPYRQKKPSITNYEKYGSGN